ncbi:putative dithiol-disulfide oxidoreductase (DUF899 family) [Sphingomonas naasensis]|uniref:DUF899 domain-containing protein n=1 Tax=Sphingomonas naasensis TaxID=1344951 RepID=A0A4S1WGM0_9SPHN|nr:DUF899 family protein [Sphingomonas naasensis]NIJ22307.1 putative dithiol-disulfide oxidoreductase (DUF899 family) [Sphingomonas naasensis]TGX40690.1 DUF899 domain-containing protein [Sphingomonas naasensis]
MTVETILPPVEVLAARARSRWPGESAEYRAARTALLADEIALRRQIERVAEQRRALPPGPLVPGDAYSFEGPEGPVTLAELFGDKDTLVVYTWMFGPQRERPCPMCTSLLSAWEGETRDIQQRVALAVTARSPLDKLETFAAGRGWKHLPLYSDADGTFSRDFWAVTPEGDDIPQLLVFSRRDGTIRFFWAGEMDDLTADPGQDPRGAPDLMPLWTILDATPEGRGADWYPKLDY